MNLNSSLLFSILIHSPLVLCFALAASTFAIPVGSIIKQSAVTAPIEVEFQDSKVEETGTLITKKANPTQTSTTTENPIETATIVSNDWNEKALWLESQIRYPKEALKNRQQGKASFSLVYDADGKLIDVRVIETPNSISLKKETFRLSQIILENKNRLDSKLNAKGEFILPLEFKIKN